jgi:hypothetical protein
MTNPLKISAHDHKTAVTQGTPFQREENSMKATGRLRAITLLLEENKDRIRKGR